MKLIDSLRIYYQSYTLKRWWKCNVSHTLSRVYELKGYMKGFLRIIFAKRVYKTVYKTDKSFWRVLLFHVNFLQWGRPKPTDRFSPNPTLGSHWISTLGIRISVHNPESHWILSAGWILPDLIGFVVGFSDLGFYFWYNRTSKAEPI
jgi:hypothetical protein